MSPAALSFGWYAHQGVCSYSSQCPALTQQINEFTNNCMTSLNCARYRGKATFKVRYCQRRQYIKSIKSLGENSESGFGGPVAQVDEEEC